MKFLTPHFVLIKFSTERKMMSQCGSDQISIVAKKFHPKETGLNEGFTVCGVHLLCRTV